MAITPGCLWHRGIQWTKGWQDTAESIMPYIILLDNFMGPILKRAEQKKSSKALHFKSNRPPSPYSVICHSKGYLMLIYWVRGWELLLECDTGQRKRDESWGSMGGAMFVTFGSSPTIHGDWPGVLRYEKEQVKHVSDGLVSWSFPVSLVWSFKWNTVIFNVIDCISVCCENGLYSDSIQTQQMSNAVCHLICHLLFL